MPPVPFLPLQPEKRKAQAIRKCRNAKRRKLRTAFRRANSPLRRLFRISIILYLQREKADIVKRTMKRFFSILIAVMAACICAYSQNAQTPSAASEPQTSGQESAVQTADAGSPAGERRSPPKSWNTRNCRKCATARLCATPIPSRAKLRAW